MIDYDAMEAAGLCDCGAPLDDHPPIPKPLPWSHGRPCSKTALDRGIGWDGRPAVEHTGRNVSRWSSLTVVPPPQPEPTKKLTRRQAEAIRVLDIHRGKQSAAARELGITSASMSLMVKRLRRIGAYFPPETA